MSFEKGNISLRVFDTPKFPNSIAPFAEQAAPPVGTVKDRVVGWVTGRHLLDRNITEETAYYGGYLRLSLCTAERKIPAALLKAEIQIEQQAVLATAGQQFLRSSQRQEIRKSVYDRLLPHAQVALRSIDLVCQPVGGLVYTTAMSLSACDTLVHHLNLVVPPRLGDPLISRARTPEAYAAQHRVDYRDLPASSFADKDGEVCLGREFLTWLWFRSETSGDVFFARDEPAAVSGQDLIGFCTQLGLLLEGPIVLAGGPDDGLVTLRRGAPTMSAAARSALLAGKQLRSARLTLSTGDEMYVATLDADEFTFRGLKLPESKENLDPVSRFQDRMCRLEQFVELFYGLYAAWLKMRSDPVRWGKTVSEMKSWIEHKVAR